MMSVKLFLHSYVFMIYNYYNYMSKLLPISHSGRLQQECYECDLCCQRSFTTSM